MNVIFERIDPLNHAQANTFVDWYKNPIMINNWTLQKEEKIEITFTIEDFKKQFSRGENDPEKIAFMIKSDSKYIGYGQFYINHPVAKTKEGRVCWPSIAIGDDEKRGKGFGYLVCKEILRLALEENCTHIEAGVFEFNEKMKSLLTKNNFKLIGKQENKTFVDGKWWASEHYLLDIQNLNPELSRINPANAQ